MKFYGRDFLKLLDYDSEEIIYLIKLAMDFKKKKKAGKIHDYLRGKNVVLLFEKDSTRTRCAFEVGAMDLGMGVTYLGPTGSQMGKKESIADTARVLARMYDGIEYRGFFYHRQHGQSAAQHQRGDLGESAEKQQRIAQTLHAGSSPVSMAANRAKPSASG